MVIHGPDMTTVGAHNLHVLRHAINKLFMPIAHPLAVNVPA